MPREKRRPTMQQPKASMTPRSGTTLLVSPFRSGRIMHLWNNGRSRLRLRKPNPWSRNRRSLFLPRFSLILKRRRTSTRPTGPGVTLIKAQMNADLLTDDLKKKRASNESFWLIGQPDVELTRIPGSKDAGKFRVSVQGFDYYNTKTGNVESGGADKIAMWMLDTDYDGRSLFPRQVFFLTAVGKDDLARLARNIKAEIDADLIEAYRGTVSLPFEAGEHGRAAIKIVDDRGIESLKIVELE